MPCETTIRIDLQPTRRGERVPRPAPVPRLTRLMALAIRSELLTRQGAIRDYAELARLAHVSRARVTQIMNLLNLAPDIQEQLLCNRCVSLTESAIRRLTQIVDWEIQREQFARVRSVAQPERRTDHENPSRGQ